MTTHDERNEEAAGPVISTQAGTADGIIGNDVPLTGHGSEEDEEGANEFFEEIGALIQGKSGEDVHEPDMKE